MTETGGTALIDRDAPEPVPLEPGEPLRRECSQFLASMSAGTPPPTDGREGVRVLRVLESASDALRSRRGSNTFATRGSLTPARGPAAMPLRGEA
jgi:predicted dehydrogenase